MYYLDHYRNGTVNSPARDHCTLQISYTPNTGPPSQYLSISFLTNGSIDTEHTLSSDLENATKLFAPTITYLQSITAQQFDFWELINWEFVALYWTFLADLGQTVPTVYAINPQSGNLNFSSPTTFPATNNIFINATLYQIYSSYLFNTILPILGIPSEPVYTVTNDTTVTLPDMTFIKSYSCIERQVKSSIDFIISVIVADYVLIVGFYSLAILIAGSLQKYRHPDGNSPFCAILITLENYCEGCEKLVKHGLQLNETIPLQMHHSNEVD